MKKLLSLLLALAMIFSLGACGVPAEEEEIATVTPGKLTVSISPDFAPMDFVDLTKEGQDMYVGFDVTLAKFIAENLRLQLVLVPMSFDACQQAVAEGSVDMSISGFSWSEEREADFNLSDYYYATINNDAQVIITLDANREKYATAEGLANAKVGVQKSSLQQDLTLSQLPESVALEVRTSAQAPFSHSLTTVGSALLLEADGTTYFYGYGGAATALDLSALSFTKIYSYALYNTNVQSVKLPAALLTIGDYAFADCAALTSVEFAEGSLLSLIGNHAFEGTSISELVLPGTVTELGYAAFANCERLADVTLTEGLAILGEKAFYHCTALAALQLPVSLEIIGPDALAECTSLASLVFGSPDHWFTEQGSPASDLSDAESNALYFREVAPFLEKGE
jgi:hypothetical protein